MEALDLLYVGATTWATVDLEPPYAWTELVPNAPGTPDAAGGASQIPGCRISDGFIVDPNVSTTTTSTTPSPSGPKTIWTWFESEINQ